MTEDINWITLATAPNEPMAELMQQRLAEAKIPVVLVPGDASAYLGASSEFEIKVPKDKVEAAKKVLE
ncbi:hypothetical protein EXS54_01275 [Patescibacteria group bacterium]|nr:hypothetical protein [Patescibacteria group bacterium]